MPPLFLPAKFCSRPIRYRGFVVVAILALLTLGIVFAIVSGLGSIERDTTNRAGTEDLMHQARELLLAHAITYPDNHTNQVFGYLPCPDMDGDGLVSGSETNCGGTNGEAVIGLLPYKMLGLSGNVDADGNCLWYAVSGTYKASSNKPTPLNWDTQGQFEIRDSDNNLLAQPNDAKGGAVAVIFSVGPPRSTQTREGTSGISPCGASASALANAIYAQYIDVDVSKADLKKSEPFPGPANGTVRLVEGIRNSDINNDHLVWITAKEVWDRIRNRSDLGTTLDTNVNSLINFLQGQLTNNLATYTPGAGNALPASLAPTAGSTLANYFDNFSDQIRYLRCSPAGTFCYKVNGMDCDGVIMFAGTGDLASNGTASPRPSTLRADTNFFESGTASGLPLLQGTATSVTAALQAFSSLTATSDIVQCLTPQPPVQISTAQMLNAANTTLSPYSLVAADGVTLTLGNTTAPGGAADAYALYGCYWYPTPVPLGNGIRIFFNYVVQDRSEGFTFTLADADPTRNPSSNMCGAGEDALGYAGNNGTTAIVNYPKIAFEVDFSQSNPGALGITRNDPVAASPGDRHFAFDYWGSDTTADDDVTHGDGGGANPLNPSGSPGLKRFNIGLGTTAYIRLDIVRTYNAVSKSATYVLNGYIAKSFSDASACFASDYPRVSDGDLDSLCPGIQNDFGSSKRYLYDAITIPDVSGSGEAMRRVYLGFTTGQHSTSTQEITISNFQAATR